MTTKRTKTTSSPKKTYCYYCGQQTVEQFTQYFNTATGERLTESQCDNDNCYVGKVNNCVRLGGHKYPKPEWYQWFYAPNCTICGYKEYWRHGE